MRIKRFFYILILLFVFQFENVSANVLSDSVWVDSVFNSLNTKEKIAQMLMIRTYSNKDKPYYDSIEELIEKYNIGGLCFFQGGPKKQAELINSYQKLSKTPLFISQDAEWGIGMRLDSVIDFPAQMTLGAIENDSLIYLMAQEIANECKTVGVNINFAPVVDINSNPNNPVINFRSFGEDKIKVKNKAQLYVNGLQDNGILATAKHFPGHGDTDSDSHFSLPLINHSKEKIDSLGLFPFKNLIKRNIAGVMVAHLYVPALDSSKNTASTISKPIVTDLLRNKLNFHGLIITDALDMKGVTKYNKPGIIELKAFQAGNDILLLPQNIEKAINSIYSAIIDSTISIEDLNIRCKKILKYKYLLGLNNFKTLKTNDIYKNLNTPETKLINRNLYENAITVVKNNNEILPLRNLDTLNMACLSIGDLEINHFQKRLCSYAKIDNYNVFKTFNQKIADSLLTKLSKYNLVILSFNYTNNSPRRNFGITEMGVNFLDSLKTKTKIILDIFANPYSLSRFTDNKNIEAIILSYQDNETAEDMSAQIIFGSMQANGKLPITACNEFQANFGMKTKKLNRLQYSLAEDLNISSEYLNKVDSIALDGILKKAYPGCRILAAKDGKIFYDKAFGYHTYDKKIKVKKTDLYDLASVTKVAATTLAIMKLQDEGKIDVDRKISEYLPYLKYTDKGNIVIRDLMTHQAKLKAWIPFYKSTVHNGKLDNEIYSNTISEKYPLRVAENLYINKYYTYNIFDSINDSELRDNHKYKYSDLGFYYLMKMVEIVSNKPFEEFLQEDFYKPLGLSSMCFKPYRYFDLDKIAPTENDKTFRMMQIHGDVHDQGAAMLGGISGHAGLFSDADDIAVILQMLLQKGNYADKKFINPFTIIDFTSYQYPLDFNRRGVGFDKPLLNYFDDGPTCKSASALSFGHSGFTGTYIWADPENNLIYVFLSNRVYPDASNRKIIDMNIRTNIHQVFYDALKEK